MNRAKRGAARASAARAASELLPLLSPGFFAAGVLELPPRSRVARPERPPTDVIQMGP